MTKNFKRTLSLLLAMMMIVGTFAAFTFTASAATAKYVKVTEAPADWSGTYLIVYEDGGKAFKGSLSGSYLNMANNFVTVTISNGEIESNADTDAAKVTIAACDGGYSIQTTGDSSYIGGVSGANKLANSSTAIANTISISEGSAKIVSNDRLLRFNTNWPGFRYYASGQQAVQLYKLEGSAEPEPAMLTINVGENGKVVMNNGTFGNAADASNVVMVASDINMPSGYTLNISEGHSADVVEGVSINISAGAVVNFYPSADNTGEITAIPDEGYYCTGWYEGDELYTATCTLDYQEITQDITLTAKFEVKTFTVT